MYNIHVIILKGFTKMREYTLLKNNDSGSPAPYGYGGYCLENCKYEVGSVSYVGSSSDSSHMFSNSNTSLFVGM